MKSLSCFIFLLILSLISSRAEEWQKVAFVGAAKVKSISGLVEVIVPKQRVLREGETAKPGEVLRIWRGADLILQMEGSKSFVRAKGPVLLRLAPEEEGFNRASVTGSEEKVGFVVRAVRGQGRYSNDGIRWADIKAGMILPEGARVRPFRDSVLDFYHNGARVALRVSNHKEITALRAPATTPGDAALTMAAKAP